MLSFDAAGPEEGSSCVLWRRGPTEEQASAGCTAGKGSGQHPALKPSFEVLAPDGASFRGLFIIDRVLRDLQVL